MPTITWEIGDTFQVLSTRCQPGSLDVNLYGILVKDGAIVIAKRILPTSNNESYSRSARNDVSGPWRVQFEPLLAKDGYYFEDAKSVPLDINTQWIPEEVAVIISAVHMALGTPKDM